MLDALDTAEGRVEGLHLPDGRWARILRTLLEHGDLRFGDLFRLVRDHQHSRTKDQRKVNRALRYMAGAGLIIWRNGEIAITSLGGAAYAEIKAQGQA